MKARHFLSLIISWLILAPGSALADGIPTIIPPKPAGALPNLPTVITNVFDFGIAAAAVIFFILLLVGGIQYLTSAGNEQGTTKAKRLLVDAIIGLVLVLASWAIGVYVLKQFRLG